MTRGAKEAEIYRKWSPSVVLVINDEGLGSGVLIGPNKVVTNAHVVGEFKVVAIVFKPIEEGRKLTKADLYRAELVGIDRARDLALLQVPSAPNGAQAIELGDVKEIEIGADVHAIGHPTGETWTYTKGIISQYRKDFKWINDDGVKHEADVIQTQTPINPGNSGGPLISDAGHLLGINSFKGEGEGLNFAISVEDVRKFLAKPMPPEPEIAEDDAGSKKCKPKILYDGRNKDDTAQIRSVDWACSGKVGAMIEIPDDPAKPIVLMISSDDSGKADRWFYDTKRRGVWDYELISSKHDGKIDMIAYGIDKNFRASRVEPYTGQADSAAN